MQTAELVALPLADRLQAMEALWDSLCREESMEVALPAWHVNEVAKRLVLIDSGQDVPTPWDAAKRRIRDKASHFNHPRFLKYHIGTSALAIMIVRANG